VFTVPPNVGYSRQEFTRVGRLAEPEHVGSRRDHMRRVDQQWLKLSPKRVSAALALIPLTFHPAPGFIAGTHVTNAPA
jgi:hypothetical protein